MSTRLSTLLVTCALSLFGADPAVVLLWPDGAPGSEGKTVEESVRLTPAGEHVVSRIHRPSLTVFLPSNTNATGAALVIAPGGGHSELWMDHEGYNVAKVLSERGVACFVLKYRLAREKGSTYSIEGNAVPDAQRALRVVRKRAAEWSLNPYRIGIMGFSAGGDLAALAATRPSAGAETAADPVERESARPAFWALIYPAIPRNLTFSKETPPAFFACGENDRQNISQGLPELYVAIKKAGGSAELHVFAGVGHGFGLRPTSKGAVAGWVDRFYEWMDGRGLLKH